MALPDPIPRREITLDVTSSKADYGVPFPFIFDMDVEVAVSTAAAPDTFVPLAYPTGYTLTGAGNPIGGTAHLSVNPEVGGKVRFRGISAENASEEVIRGVRYNYLTIEQTLLRFAWGLQETARDTDDLGDRVDGIFEAVADAVATTTSKAAAASASATTAYTAAGTAAGAADTAGAAAALANQLANAAPDTPVGNGYSARHWAALAQALSDTFDLSSYSTTAQIEAILEGYVPTARTIASGNGVMINGGASATLGSTVTVSLDFATDAEAIAGTNTGKPVAPAGLHAAIVAALASASGVPIGTWDHFSGQTPPAGYLVRDGSAVSRTTYAALFAVCGTTYGAGDGSTTFNLPDGRGVFDRGWDGGRGLDSGRVFGSYQADELKSHTHTIQRIVTGGIVIEGISTISQTPNGTFASGATGGTETRPKNIAGLPIIRAY
ncbi:MAG: phage-related tail fiber protein [Proteobacteria bacterium]|nr:phage-related tail fiber protein [Pseudomonadota bacterium]